MKRIKKKLLPLALALAMCLGMCHGNAITAQAAGAAVVLIPPGVYGFANDPQFSDGLMPVKDPNTNKWGYINTAGQLAIPCLYESVWGFQEGAAKVIMDNSTYAFIGTAGQMLFSWRTSQGINPVVDAKFSEGMIAVHDYGSGGGYGFLNMAGQLVVPCQYGDGGMRLRDFVGGMAAVFVNDKGRKKWGFVNAAGQLAVACQYDQVKDFSDGLAAVHDEGSNCWGYVDAAGNVAIPFQYKNAYSFAGGYAPVELADGSGRWELIDKTGRNVVPAGYRYVNEPSYEHIAEWNNFETNCGIVWVRKDGDEKQLLYMLDRAGGLTPIEDRRPVIVDDPGRFKEDQDGVAVAGVGNIVHFRWIDTTGKALYGGLFEGDNGNWGIRVSGGRGVRATFLTDREGNKIMLPEGIKSDGAFCEGFLPVYDSKATGKPNRGFVNTAGQLAVPCAYAEVKAFSGGVAPVKNAMDRWGLVDSTGAEVLPLQYTSIEQVRGAAGVFFAKDGNGTSLVAAPAVYAANGAVVNYVAQAEVNDALNAGIATEALGVDYREEITRAQLASEAVKLYEAASGQAAPAAGATPFSDVNDPAVTQAQTLGLIDGLPDGTFVPNATVPKEQAAAILSGVSAKVNGTDAGVKAAKFEPEGSTRKTASIEETLATATRILKKIKK